jgi:predicted PurR-regulated permease PerM
MKTVVSLLTGILSYIVLAIIGVDFAVFWAFLIFLLNYIPTIGSLIATIFPALMALLQEGNFSHAFWVIAGVGAIQILVGNFIEPKVMGNSLNISSLVVILSLVIWGSLWGIIGMIIAVPITVIMIIIMAQFPNSRKFAIMLSKDGIID